MDKEIWDLDEVKGLLCLIPVNMEQQQKEAKDKRQENIARYNHDGDFK